MKEKIISLIAKQTSLSKDQIEKMIEVPKDPKLGDYAFPCFILSKEYKKNPIEIAQELAQKIKSKEFEKIESSGPYINFFIDRSILASETIKQIQKEKDFYGTSNEGKGKNIVIDMSSPNIAKPFGIGHLRSTIIGNSIAKISQYLGYKAIKINYLGDWGTQFGKLIVGYNKIGSEAQLKKDPIKHMLSLYIEGNKEEYGEQARDWFKKLEQGDREAISLWKKFKKYSLKDFNNIYKILGIKFDIFSGESNYNSKMEETIKELENKGLLESSQGAKVVNLEKYNLGICLIKKSDDATLYATRDITAALERYKKYKFSKMIYEVGQEQKLHFQQVFKILELLGYKWAKDCIHVSHGLYLDKDGKKFATRKGKTIFMEDILTETISLAKEEIKKRETLSSKELEERAEKIALSAIFYGDLKNHRTNDVVFNIEKFLSFEGNTGPYLLYSYARAKSILIKAKYKPEKLVLSDPNDKEKELINKLANFPEIIINSFNNFSPNIIANYTYELSQIFNEFYHSNRVIGSENEQFRLALIDSFAQVLKNALSLLGISVIDRM
ncbi:MAG: arginine--tRNA ligase [Nanoarchaeota archaeon]